MDTHIVVGIGELLWDCFDDARRPGGAPTNVAFHASQLGMLGRVVSRVGHDADGAALLDELVARGLSTDFIQRDSSHRTGRVTVDTTRARQPVYTIHEDVAWDHLESDDSVALAMVRASAICFGTLAQRSSTSRTTIQGALEANSDALLVYDVNLRPPWYAREVIETSLHRCHVVKLNDEEVRVLAELLDLGTTSREDLAAILQTRFDVPIVCVTRGERGCLVLTRDEHVDVPGHEVTIVDTVGAGDAFTAALVCGLLWRWPVVSAARFANEVGALVAGAQGAMPELRDTLGRLRDCYAETRHGG